MHSGPSCGELHCVHCDGQHERTSGHHTVKRAVWRCLGLITHTHACVCADDVTCLQLCSGQSNMQFTVASAFNATEEIAAAANFPFIRLFTASLISSNTPQNQLLGIEEPWSVASPEAVGNGNWSYFSAVWFVIRNEVIHFSHASLLMQLVLWPRHL